ncbi:hypothetical protein B0O80DRAFT_240025 [Mortierella sp. GBAus27b]|nr:hypothetical protein B0O80DRAFT_240025 [Mortierella sp. GBAus27b]
MAQLNPIVFIPPVALVLAIIGILLYRYWDRIQVTWADLVYRLRGQHTEEQDALFDEEFEEDELDDTAYTEDLEELGEDDQADTEPQGATTSARLRMHHEMVQQMRVRAGFAPEPFPGDQIENAEDGEDDEGGEEEDDGGVGSSNGAAAAGSASRIKKIGKKKAEKLQRKEQMRAYREFMEMQREERRQQEEMFKAQEAIQQEERRRKRSEQIEQDKKRKEQRKEKEAKENATRMKRIQTEKLKQDKARKDLREYIQRVKTFRLPTLAKRLGRTEAQLLKDLAAVAQDEDIASSGQSAAEVPRIVLASGFTTSSPSSPVVPSLALRSPRPQLLILHDPASDQYVVLDESKLAAFAQAVQTSGRISKKELSTCSEAVFRPDQTVTAN